MFNKFGYVYMEEAGDGEGGSSGGSEGSASGYSEDQVRSLIDEAVSGLKAKNSELIGKLKDAKTLATKFDGLDPDKVRSMMDAFDKSEEAKLIAEGKFDEIVERRMDKMRSDYEAKFGELEKNQSGLLEERNKYKQMFESKTVEDVIRNEALKAGVLPQAIDDVVYRARQVFSVGDAGEVEARDRNGNLLKTDDDYIMTPDRFIKGLEKVAPHYWPASQGGGSRGSSTVSREDAMAKLSDMLSSGEIDMNAYREQRKKLTGSK